MQVLLKYKKVCFPARKKVFTVKERQTACGNVELTRVSAQSVAGGHLIDR
jgi:hypothetical protein